jgi:hypothetical protein
MSKEPIIIKIPEPKGLRECVCAVENLFDIVAELHGEHEAYRIFTLPIFRPPSKKQANRQKNCDLAFEYYSTTKANKEKFARDVAERNASLPKEERWGPRGSTNPATIRRHLNRLLNEEYIKLWIEFLRSTTKAKLRSQE